MGPWLRRLRIGAPYLFVGTGIALFMAWGLPLLFAARGIGAIRAPTRYWFDESTSQRESDDSRARSTQPVAWLELRRSMFSDWFSAEPAVFLNDAAVREVRWPEGELVESTLEPRHRSPPGAVAVAPPLDERDHWSRLDTVLAGWPFRSFAGYAWYPSASQLVAGTTLPEFRSSMHIGTTASHHILVPLRPLPIGLALSVLFWSTAAWMSVAIPSTIRRARREKYNRCPACGYAVDPRAPKLPTRCPECGEALRRDPLGVVRSPEMHFQNAYVWLVFVSSLDIMLTWKILDRGGVEVNPLAALVIDAWGMHGAIAFKFALMLWVVVICEVLARLRTSAGRMLAYLGVGVSSLPVVWSLGLLLLHALAPEYFAE